ncbi:hypothetical protein ABZ621_36560 [Streptomyces sp. NPDC007863]|jgi:hypothetical protein|uniref:hypothetical protein n=1 Tax=Streptomyces sp. NPDC007863 TaxID=3154894 RepID=UPI003410BB98
MTYGQIAYQGYAEHTNNKTHDDREMPAWSDLGDSIQGAWEAAAWAVLRKNAEGLNG